KVLEAFINHGAGDVLFGIAREEGEFGEQASEADELAAQDPLLFLSAAGGKSNIKVAHAHLSQAPVQRVNEQRDADAECSDQRTRQTSHDVGQQPDRDVLKAIAHQLRNLGEPWTVPLEVNNFKWP